MLSNISKFKFLFPVLLALSVFQKTQVSAQEFFCATVMPDCDKDGNPLAPFDDTESPCYPIYSNMCLRIVIEKLQEEKEVICTKEGNPKAKKNGVNKKQARK